MAIIQEFERVESSTKIEHCKRCGRKLKNEKFKLIGFGAVCYKKYLNETKLQPLFIVKERKP